MRASKTTITPKMSRNGLPDSKWTVAAAQQVMANILKASVVVFVTAHFVGGGCDAPDTGLVDGRVATNPGETRDSAGCLGLSRYLRAVTNTCHGTSAAGRAGAVAPYAARRTATRRGRLGELGHRRLPVEVRQQLLDAIYSGEPFRTVIRKLNLTPNQIWGLAKTDERWSAELEAALTATPA
jgi:hypothetical protein